MTSPRKFIGSAAFLLAAGVLLSAGPSASADVFTLNDGTTIDGKVLKEEAGVLTVKTVGDVRRINVADIKERKPGEAATDIYEKLKKAVETNPRDAESLWSLYGIAKANETLLPKGEAGRWLQRLLKVAPDHELARDANGEVKFDGKWVLKTDLPRLEAEAAREKKRRDWEVRMGTHVEMADGDHWVVLDGSGSKDLGKRAQQLDDCYRKMCEIFGLEKMWGGQANAFTFKRYDTYATFVDDLHKSSPMPDWKLKAAKMQALGGFWRHQPSPYVCRFVTDKGEEGMWHAVVHSAAHVAIWWHFGTKNPPEWLNEGLGSWIEIEIMGVQRNYCVGIGGSSKEKGTSDKPKKKPLKPGELSEAVNEYKEKCIEAVRDGSFPEMRKFLRMKIGDYGPAEAGGALALCTWLMGKDGEKFKTLVAALRKAPDEPKAGEDDKPWREIYAWNLIEDMEKEWKVWVTTQW